MRKTKQKSSLLLSLVLLAAGAFAASLQAQVPEQTVWIDVRSAGEFAGDHLDGAVHIPYDAIEKGVAGLQLSADTPIYLYCAVGGRAEKARRSLVAAGYNNVVNVGGLSDARKLSAQQQLCAKSTDAPACSSRGTHPGTRSASSVPPEE